MPDMFVASLPGQRVQFLDVSPMISALRFQPTDFEYAHGRLRHVPSSLSDLVEHNGSGEDRRPAAL